MEKGVFVVAFVDDTFIRLRFGLPLHYAEFLQYQEQILLDISNFDFIVVLKDNEQPRMITEKAEQSVRLYISKNTPLELVFAMRSTVQPLAPRAQQGQ